MLFVARPRELDDRRGVLVVRRHPNIEALGALVGVRVATGLELLGILAPALDDHDVHDSSVVELEAVEVLAVDLILAGHAAAHVGRGLARHRRGRRFYRGRDRRPVGLLKHVRERQEVREVGGRVLEVPEVRNDVLELLVRHAHERRERRPHVLVAAARHEAAAVVVVVHVTAGTDRLREPAVDLRPVDRAAGHEVVAAPAYATEGRGLRAPPTSDTAKNAAALAPAAPYERAFQSAPPAAAETRRSGRAFSTTPPPLVEQ